MLDTGAVVVTATPEDNMSVGGAAADTMSADTMSVDTMSGTTGTEGSGSVSPTMLALAFSIGGLLEAIAGATHVSREGSGLLALAGELPGVFFFLGTGDLFAAVRGVDTGGSGVVGSSTAADFFTSGVFSLAGDFVTGVAGTDTRGSGALLSPGDLRSGVFGAVVGGSVVVDSLAVADFSASFRLRLVSI